MFDLVTAVVADDATTVTECRRCGTTLDADATECSACHSEAVVTYDIS